MHPEDELTCADCDVVWHRPRKRGKKPARCGDCSAKRHAEQSKAHLAVWRAANYEQEKVDARARTARYRVELPEAARAASRRAHVMARYGLTIEQYEQLQARGKCDLCGTTSPGTKLGWHTDHDHSCCPPGKPACGGCVRGLLCHRCNTLAGVIERNPSLVEAITAYIAASPRVSFPDP